MQFDCKIRVDENLIIDIDLKFLMLRDEVFCIYCGKYHECMF